MNLNGSTWRHMQDDHPVDSSAPKVWRMLVMNSRVLATINGRKHTKGGWTWYPSIDASVLVEHGVSAGMYCHDLGTWTSARAAQNTVDTYLRSLVRKEAP